MELLAGECLHHLVEYVPHRLVGGGAIAVEKVYGEAVTVKPFMLCNLTIVTLQAQRHVDVSPSGDEWEEPRVIVKENRCFPGRWRD